MRQVITILLLTMVVQTAAAECTSSGIWCWPEGSTIKKNPVFIITFYGFSQEFVPQIGKKNAFYLRTGSQKIPLLIKEICKGEFELTQILLKPVSDLQEGLEYELSIDGLPRFPDFAKWNSKTGKREKIKWLVGNTKDLQRPQWVESPTYISRTMVEYGCGPAKWVNFNSSFSDHSDIVIKTTVKSIQTGKATTYYLTKNEKDIKVGHGMCSGAFHFDDGEHYEVGFSLMDQSGNTSLHDPRPILFSRPTTPTPTE